MDQGRGYASIYYLPFCFFFFFFYLVHVLAIKKHELLNKIHLFFLSFSFSFLFVTESRYVVQTCLKLTMFPFFLFVLQGTKPRALSVQGKCSTTELYPQPNIKDIPLNEKGRA
jgi:hypothetical protein